jgi:hypothetical protein
MDILDNRSLVIELRKSRRLEIYEPLKAIENPVGHLNGGSSLPRKTFLRPKNMTVDKLCVTK